MTELKLYFDASNKDKYIQYGWVLYNKEVVIAEDYGRITTNESTCNFAEHCGLAYGLRYLYDNPIEFDFLRIFGDSQLIVNHVNGKWRCKNERLLRMLKLSKLLLKLINVPWEITWIPRAQNSYADKLTRR